MTREKNPPDAFHDQSPSADERLRALLGDGLEGVPVTADEEAAAGLTAHALGELSPAEVAEIERRLAGAAGSDQRTTVRELGVIGEALRKPAAVATGLRAPVGSAAIRTAVTAALAAGDHTTHQSPGAVAQGALAAPRARRGLFASGALSSLPMLVAAGSTAAAVLAVIMVQEQANRVTLEERVAHDAAQTVVFDRRASPLAAAPSATAAPVRRGQPGDTAASVAVVLDDARPSEADKSFDAEFGSQSIPAADALPASAPVAILALPALEVNKAMQGAGAQKPQSGSGIEGQQAARARGASLPEPLFKAPPANLDAALSLASEQRQGLSESLAYRSHELARESALSDARDGSGLEDQKSIPDRRREPQQALAQLDRNFASRGTERYGKFVENAFRHPQEQPLSTFSIDVDTASYALVRRFLHDRQLPPPDAVRLEEMLNYFSYDDALPEGDDPFSVSLETAACPWRAGHRLVRVGLKGREIAAAARPGTSLVFLVDVSGSMNEPNKLPLVKQSLSMLVEQLTENDTVTIVTYAGDAGLKLAPTSGEKKGRIRAAIDALSAGGSTNGSAGIEMAYSQAAAAFVKGGSNRVVLATDGDLNVGVTSDAALVELIKHKASGGVFLTVLGFGEGNLQDEKMEKLADNGNGLYAYIDGAREARKVLVEQLTGSTVTIAKDVKIQVEFNPTQVAAYRLLGYENRIMATEDFRDDTKDAGEIGAGHGVTALYEIVPIATAAQSPVGPEPLKYQPQSPVAAKPEPAPADGGPISSELLTVKLRWKAPHGDTSTLREFPLEDSGATFENASTNLRFAAAVAQFGMLLRGSEHRGQATLAHVTATAAGALGTDPGGLRAEFLDLVREAGALVPQPGGAGPRD